MPISNQAMGRDLPTSKFRFFSVGVVASVKERASRVIKVTPIEELTMLDGELTQNAEQLEVDGQAKDGSSYSNKAVVSSVVEAIWLPFESTNRRTAPDVRIGEEVMIYQYADNQENLFWTTLRDGFKYRRLETVRYLFSADPSGPPKEDGTNCYGFEVSTHERTITLSTSKSNGEKYKYTVQINAGDGILTITDDIDNAYSINSEGGIVEMKNCYGVSIRMQGKDLITTVPGNTIEEIGGNASSSVGGSSSSSVGGSRSEDTGGSHSTSAGGSRTVNAAGINHNSSGSSVSRSSGTATIAGTAIHFE